VRGKRFWRAKFEVAIQWLSRMPMRPFRASDVFAYCVGDALHKNGNRDDQSNQEKHLMHCYP
jgi:hypothetical protein